MTLVLDRELRTYRIWLIGQLVRPYFTACANWRMQKG
jgi:hypothetical protein